MSEMVPEGWEKRKLGDFCREKSVKFDGKSQIPVLSVTKYDGFVSSLDYFNKQIFSRDLSSYKVVRKGQFTYATIHLDEGSLGLLSDYESGLISPMYTVFETTDELDSKYLFFLMKSDLYMRKYPALGQGSINRRASISFKSLSELAINSPPLPEQKKIASILTSVDEVIEKTQSQIDKLQDLKKGTMNELLTKGIGHTEFKDSELGRIPKSWEVCIGEELLDPQKRYPMRSGPFGSALLKSALAPEGIPFLGIDNVHKEFFKTEYHRFISEQKFNELDHYQVFPDDVMVTIMGTVGRCCIVPKNIPKAISSKHTWVITFDKKKILPELVCWQINYSNWVLKNFADNSQGGVMDAISSETLRNTKFPVPPIAEQHKISRAYQNIGNLINFLVNRLDKTQSLKKSLMQDLLTGKVRVSVN